MYEEKISPCRFDVARNRAMARVSEDTDICVSNDLDEVFESGWREKLENAWNSEHTRARYMFVWSHNEDNSIKSNTLWKRSIGGMILKQLGVSGKEEATLDFYGAVHGLHLDEGLLVDVGGGSTELVLYKGGRPLMAESLALGSLNLFRRHVSGLMPTKKEFWNIHKEITGLLKRIKQPPD